MNSEAKETSHEAKRADLPVTGMTCAACSSRVQNTLSELKGVEKASVNLAAAQATIYYNPSETSVDEVVKTIKDLGYGFHFQQLPYQ